MSKKYCRIEVVAGAEGPSLSVSDGDLGYRLAGPKPWGGGRIIQAFDVSLDELIAKAKEHAFTKKD